MDNIFTSHVLKIVYAAITIKSNSSINKIKRPNVVVVLISDGDIIINIITMNMMID